MQHHSLVNTTIYNAVAYCILHYIVVCVILQILVSASLHYWPLVVLRPYFVRLL